MGNKSKAARGGAARRAPTAASPDTLLADGRALHAHAMMACAEGKVARLRELLAMLSFEGVQELLFCADWAEETSLLKMASGQGHLEVVKLLVACGANPNDDGADDDDPDPESTRKAPLHMAAACGHTDVVRWLVREGGADARQLDRNGCNAYHLGCVQGHTDVVRFMVEEVGLDVNEKEMFGGTGLGWAMKRGHAELAQWLCEHGARLGVGDASR